MQEGLGLRSAALFTLEALECNDSLMKMELVDEDGSVPQLRSGGREAKSGELTCGADASTCIDGWRPPTGSTRAASATFEVLWDGMGSHGLGDSSSAVCGGACRLSLP